MLAIQALVRKGLLSNPGSVTGGIIVVSKNYGTLMTRRSDNNNNPRPAVAVKGYAKPKPRRVTVKELDSPDYEQMDKFRKELRKEFETFGDQPEMDVLAGMESDTDGLIRDYSKARMKVKRNKMFRRHFREFIDFKEVSVLTYAEKEKIRYLHTSDPTKWTPETLSDAFPVSPDGVQRLLKSKFRLNSMGEIISHDKRVQETIERIQQREIPMTPDLAYKMKMREELPIQIGTFDPTDKALLVQVHNSVFPSKPIGEFQRLVTPTSVFDETKRNNATEENGNVPPLSSAIRREPDLGDYYYLDPKPDTVDGLEKLKINPNKRMTLRELQAIIASADSKGMVLTEEMRYLSSLQKKKQDKKTEYNPEPTTLADFEKESDELLHEKIVNPSFIQKFEEEEETFIANNKTKSDEFSLSPIYHKDGNTDRIHVPYEHGKKGTVYQRGKTFYDENGEFLYKVI